MPDPELPSRDQPAPVRSALFVDFDNIYLRLQQEDPRAAEQFATNPARWLAWLRDGLPHEDGLPRRRKILFRRCYLNPLHFGRYRPDFSRAAFEVVDCPPLTSSGKTSADIHMVLDIVDALQHVTHFDEFIVLSGDADFTPVLLRLSKHDRRSAVLAIGPAAAAFKAACDLLIDEDTFLEEAIGVVAGHGRAAGLALSGFAGTPLPSPIDELLRQIGARVHERASGGELVATDLPAIYREFPEFTSSTNWLGFKTLRQMTVAVTHTRQDLEMVEGDPWRVKVIDLPPGEDAAPAVDTGQLIAQILDLVREVVAAADSAVPMARMAQIVIARFGDQVLRSHWAGAGSFRELLSGHDGSGFVVSSAKPGFVYDPDRHQVPAEGKSDELEETDPELAALAYRIHQVTDTPYLTPAEYALLFRLIAEEVTQHGYFLHRTSKAVRDRSVEENSPVARMSINFILRGIVFSGYRFGLAGEENAGDLARCFARNVLVLCDNAGLQLGDEDRVRVYAWVAGDDAGDELPPAAAVGGSEEEEATEADDAPGITTAENEAEAEDEDEDAEADEAAE